MNFTYYPTFNTEMQQAMAACADQGNLFDDATATAPNGDEVIDVDAIAADAIAETHSRQLAAARAASDDDAQPDDDPATMLETLANLSDMIRDRQLDLHNLTHKRNAIVAALARHDCPVSELCTASGLTRSRVYAIIDGQDD